jgi:hypothetical protein
MESQTKILLAGDFVSWAVMMIDARSPFQFGPKQCELDRELVFGPVYRSSSTKSIDCNKIPLN